MDLRPSLRGRLSANRSTTRCSRQATRGPAAPVDRAGRSKPTIAAKFSRSSSDAPDSRPRGPHEAIATGLHITNRRAREKTCCVTSTCAAADEGEPSAFLVTKRRQSPAGLDSDPEVGHGASSRIATARPTTPVSVEGRRSRKRSAGPALKRVPSIGAGLSVRRASISPIRSPLIGYRPLPGRKTGSNG